MLLRIAAKLSYTIEFKKKSKVVLLVTGLNFNGRRYRFVLLEYLGLELETFYIQHISCQ